MTGWDLYKTLDYERIYQGMVKAAFLFNGRNIVDRIRCFDIGFKGFSIGKAALTYHEKKRLKGGTNGYHMSHSRKAEDKFIIPYP